MSDPRQVIGLVLTRAQAVLVRDALDVIDPLTEQVRLDREYLLAKLDLELRAEKDTE